MIAPWYAAREDIKAALDVAETSRTNSQIDRALAGGSRAVDSLCHRTFYPWTGARTFDYPHQDSPTSWRLWLDEHSLISATSVVSGGRPILAGEYILRPDNGPPFTYVELLVSTDASFGGGDTWQRDITITGLWGHGADSAPAGALAEVLDTTETDVDVTDSAAVRVGDLLLVDSERMQVTGKRMTDTGHTVAGAGLAASMAGQVLTPSGGTWAEGETLLIGAERVLVEEVAGANLIVRRAWDGSTLAAHAGDAIYAPRTATVTRGAVGTTAASHSNGAALTRHVPPSLVTDLTIAEALITLLQERSGYVGGKGTSGEGRQARADYGSAVTDLRAQVYAAHGRKVRHRAV